MHAEKGRLSWDARPKVCAFRSTSGLKMNDHCHILRLPVELLQHVFEYVEKDDLSALRYTSAAINAAVLDRYASLHRGCTYCNLKDPKSLQRVMNRASVQAFRSKMNCIHFEVSGSDARFKGLDESSLKKILRSLRDPWRTMWLEFENGVWYAQDYELLQQVIDTFVAAPYLLAGIQLSRTSTRSSERPDNEPLPMIVTKR